MAPTNDCSRYTALCVSLSCMFLTETVHYEINGFCTDCSNYQVVFPQNIANQKCLINAWIVEEMFMCIRKVNNKDTLAFSFDNKKKICRGFYEAFQDGPPIISDIRYFNNNKLTRCRSGFHRVGSQCLYKSTNSRSWKDARAACKGKNSHLVVTRNLHEYRALVCLLKDDEEPFWVGGRSENKIGWWYWDFFNDTMSFDFWVDIPSLPHRHCVKFNGGLQEGLCRNVYRFICQYEL